MRKLIAVNLCVSLVFAHPHVWAGLQLQEKAHHQYLVQTAASMVFEQLAKAKTGEDLAKFLTSAVPKRDQDYVHEKLKTLAQAPKFKKLNRGFAFEHGGQKFSVVVEDIQAKRFTINGKPWTYLSENPFQVQIEALARSLEPKSAAVELLFPRANAIGVIEFMVMVVLAGIVGAMLSNTVNTLYNDMFKPMLEVWWCKGADRNDYTKKKFCKDYFADLADSNRGSLDSAKPVVPTGTQVVPKAPKCSTKEDPTFSLEIDIIGRTGSRVTVRRTIHYHENLKPKEMIEEVIQPPTGDRLTYKIDDKGQLFEVSDGKDFLLTRDPAKKEIMSTEKLLEMAAFDETVKRMKAAVTAQCDEKARAQLEAASAQPGSLVSQVVQTTDSATIPAPAGKTPARATK